MLNKHEEFLRTREKEGELLQYITRYDELKYSESIVQVI